MVKFLSCIIKQYFADLLVSSFIQVGIAKQNGALIYYIIIRNFKSKLSQKHMGSAEIWKLCSTNLAIMNRSIKFFYKMLNLRIKLSGKEWEQTDKQYQGKDLRAYKIYFKKDFKTIEICF